MSPTLASAIDVAESLAWFPIANGTGSTSWYAARRETATELAARLRGVRIPVGASAELRLLVRAMRRAAAASYSNR